jgi:hypothetical protein
MAAWLAAMVELPVPVVKLVSPSTLRISVWPSTMSLELVLSA